MLTQALRTARANDVVDELLEGVGHWLADSASKSARFVGERRETAAGRMSPEDAGDCRRWTTCSTPCATEACRQARSAAATIGPPSHSALT